MTPSAYKKALLAMFLVPIPFLMTTPMLLLRRCFGCSFFTFEGSLKVVTRSAGVVTPAIKSFSLFWNSKEDSFSEALVCDLLTRDLAASGQADFRPLTGGYALR